MNTISRTINGSTHARVAAAHLVTQSIWFEFMPLPNDQWEITVKVEHAYLLEEI